MPIGRKDEALPMSWVVSETLRYVRSIGLEEEKITRYSCTLYIVEI